MKNQTQKSFGRKVLENIVKLATPILAVISPGCITKGFVTPELGINIPMRQAGLEFDSTVSYGLRGGIKTKSGVEVEVGYRGHNTSYNDGFQKNTLDATDLSVGATILVWTNGRVEVYAVPKLISRGEEDTSELIGFPGSELTETRSSTGYGIGVGARVQAGKGEIDARLTYEGFGEGSYEESGVNASVGYTFSF